jgi:hypothetical protein
MSVTLKKHHRTSKHHVSHSGANPETDRELEWLFTCAESEIDTPSNWDPLADDALSGDHCSIRHMDRVEARADAMHRARIIFGWLESLPPVHSEVLVAAYQPQVWPSHYELTLGRLAGVVAALPGVREDFRRARSRGETSARDPVDWLDMQIIRRDSARAEAAWEEALALYARAFAAYRKARGNRPCLV